MAIRRWSSEDEAKILSLHSEGWDNASIAACFPGTDKEVIRKKLWYLTRSKAPEPPSSELASAPASLEEGETSFNQETGKVTHLSTEKKTPEEILEEMEIDQDLWEIKSSKITHRTGYSKLGPAAGSEIVTITLWYTQIQLGRKKDEDVAQQKALQALLTRIEQKAPLVLPPPFFPEKESESERQLEIAVMDPHFGLRCHPPGSDQPWSLSLASETYWWAIQSLWAQAEPHGPYNAIVFPIGNDFFHADSLHHATTAGTPQPETESFHHTYSYGLDLLLSVLEWLAERTPNLFVYQVPGNHDRFSSFTAGLTVKAYFHNTPHVHVDASSSPYKFHRFGKNLIGYEHGHSVNALRLGTLMANERPQDWAETSFREWHLGDQHRKGSSKPSSFEEQGVSIEYLPGLTPPNEWHRLKAYNFQKRGAMAYAWDANKGPIARLGVNMDSYTGRPMGEGSS